MKYTDESVTKAPSLPAARRLTAIVLLLALPGCNAEPQVLKDRAEVSGAVVFDGQPLPAGTITFKSAEGPISTAVAIREGGVYSTDRAPIGKNVVTIDTRSIQLGNPANYVPIPDRYNEPHTSGLTVEIKPGANENVNFTLDK